MLYWSNYWNLEEFPIPASPFKIVEPHLFERVRIALRGNDVHDIDRQSIAEHMHEPNFDFDYPGPMTEDEQNLMRTLRVHETCNDVLFQAWNEKVDKLMTMKNLRYVIVSLQGLFCATGCCRIRLLDETPVRRLLRYLRESDEPFVHGRPRVVFMGLRDEKEVNIIFNEYGFPDLYGELRDSKAQKKKSSGDLGDSEQVTNGDSDTDSSENDDDGDGGNGDEDSSEEGNESGEEDDEASTGEYEEEYDDEKFLETTSDQGEDNTDCSGEDANEESSEDRDADLSGAESEEESTIAKGSKPRKPASTVNNKIPTENGEESSVEEADEDGDDGVGDRPRKVYTLEQAMKVIISDPALEARMSSLRAWAV